MRMEKGSRYGCGFTLWFSGLSGAGKTTISEIVEKELRGRFGKVEFIDGDIVRTNLYKGLDERCNIPPLAGERAEGLLGVV
jgi:adenylylsulfate kinase